MTEGMHALVRSYADMLSYLIACTPMHNYKSTCTTALHLGVAVVKGGPIPADPPPLKGITVDTIIGGRPSLC